MKFSNEADSNNISGNCLIIPKDRYRSPKDLIGGLGSVSRGLLEMTKKEYRKRKKREKENQWNRYRRRNSGSPVVVRLPKDSTRSALQTVHKESGKARDHHFYQAGLNHDWVGYYDKNITSDQSCINEWNAMANLESRRPPSPDSFGNKKETELLIRGKLKEIMMSVNIDEVTSKYIRQRLEEDLSMDLFKYKSFIDQEMLTILGQMDAATQIFPHVYLGSEWNASNLEELRDNRVGFILNVTKEIDNFFPGMFDYLNIRVYDDEKTELLRHWDDTYRYISLVSEKGSRVLVHCKMGISRSASVVIAYAMKAYNMSLEEATELVKRKRSCIKPNQAFTSQLKIYQGILDASRQRHNALFRSKSETNLKASDHNRSIHKSSLTPTPMDDDCTRGSQLRGKDRLSVPDFKPNRATMNTASDESDTSPSGSYDACSLLVPPRRTQRPKSWSPDEDTSRFLSLNNYEESKFGELAQKCHSLNEQIWHARVTVEQRDLRALSGGFQESYLVEAVNPIYVPRTVPSSPTSVQPGEDLQMSSSVKERISEFESAKAAGAKSSRPKSPSSNSVGSTKGSIASYPDNIFITTASDSNSDGQFTDYKDIDITVDAFPTSSISSINSDIAQSSFLASNFQAVATGAELDQCNEMIVKVDEVPDTSVVIQNESITWPAGIVRKQKEDFEEKVRSIDATGTKLPVKGKDGDVSQVPLSRHASSQSLGTSDDSSVRVPDEAGDAGRKDDLLSMQLNAAFDSEELREKRGILPEDFTQIPSRNNSWGSFDSAVVLQDRDAPSRQSSWGSCDTRISVGSVLSRNSSFGTFDGKQTGLVRKDFVYPVTNPVTAPLYDKDAIPLLSPSVVRKNKANMKQVNISPVSELDNAMPRSNTVIKALGPTPYRTLSESETVINKDMCSSHVSPSVSCSNIAEQISAESRLQADDFSSACSLQPKDTVSFFREKIPVPGMVKQTRLQLENRTELAEDPNQAPRKNNEVVHNIGRSLSSGCMSTFSNAESKVFPITRSASEKRSKSVSKMPAEGVKKIMSALENTAVSMCEPTLRNVVYRVPIDPLARSHSLDRLGDFAQGANKTLSTLSGLHASDRSESQCFLDQLVVETQAQVQQLEKEQEEITVKNLVDMFEVGKAPSFIRGSSSLSPPSINSSWHKSTLPRRKARPRSESIGEKELPPVPPVPQRKSSLDYSFRPVPESPVRVSNATDSSRHPVSPSSPSGQVMPPPNPFHFTNGICKRTSCNTTKPLPPPPSIRTCGNEVRRRKQQGKTHPLSKLTTRENPL